MSDATADRELASVITRLEGHTRKIGPWVVGDIQETIGLLERMQRRIQKLESDIEAAYAESDGGQ